MNELNIRPAGPEDSATIYGFIMKMARYEKLESEVDTTEQRSANPFLKKDRRKSCWAS